MRKYEVIIAIHLNRNAARREKFVIEAGTKKMAAIRALSEVGNNKMYSNVYKEIISVKELYY